MSYNPTAPTTTAATSSNADNYFSSAAVHKTQSTNTTPASTPGLKVEFFDQGGHRIPALNREFPKPTEELDIQSMLDRQPGRWTFKGQHEANLRRAQHAQTEEDKAQRQRDFEKAKEDLRASFRF
ncbi:hypothetical protein F53441_12793 [Fusarium austroafricanum]|uniref:Uncharacterized protein n=1 Tax=Fusarium austroafricanum TaxID=2364996 RepID=A0A8H4JU93_9HYPO|nr:hypothetical protein F53441_12793 [Fusarium austroafricanum]